MKATILDLRRKMSKVLRALDRNEPVTLLYRGREKGVIHPAGRRKGRTESASKHTAFGMWKHRSDIKNVAEHVRRMRKGRSHAL
jgi:antitoxin (DNA-binding transcriptional repressor) of toxin-antitoxin stability system